MADPLPENTSYQRHDVNNITRLTNGGNDLSVLITALVLSAVIISGATLTIVAIACTPQLRTKSNAFLVSLSVTDLLVGLELISTALAQNMLFHDMFHNSTLGCLALLCFFTSTHAVSLLNMLLVAVDRWVYICKPFVYARFVTTARITYSIALCWSIGIIYAMNQFETPSSKNLHCSTEELMRPIFYYYVTPIITSICSLCIFSIYAHIFIVARRVRRNIEQEMNRFRRDSCKRSSPDLDTEILHEMLQLVKASMARKDSWKTTKTTIALFALFFIGTLPKTVSQAVGNPHIFADNVFTVLAHFSSGITFAAYPIASTEFRHAYRKLLCPCFARSDSFSSQRSNFSYHSPSYNQRRSICTPSRSHDYVPNPPDLKPSASNVHRSHSLQSNFSVTNIQTLPSYHSMFSVASAHRFFPPQSPVQSISL